jgi:hypothetical protein
LLAILVINLYKVFLLHISILFYLGLLNLRPKIIFCLKKLAIN